MKKIKYESHYTEEEQRIMIKAAEDKYNSYTVEDHMDDAAMERYPGNCGRDIYIPWLNKLVTKTDLTISDSHKRFMNMQDQINKGNEMTKKQEETLNILKSKYDVDNIYSTFGQVNFSIDGRVSLGGFIFKNGSVRMVGGRRYIVRDGLLIGLDVWHK